MKLPRSFFPGFRRLVVLLLGLAAVTGAHAQYTAVLLSTATFSHAFGTYGNTQVGDDGTHAQLWHGTAGSAIDLNPPGFTSSYAYSISGNSEVGWGYGPATGNRGHALLWKGTAGSYVDLNPPGMLDTTAERVSGNNAVGWGAINSAGDIHALEFYGQAGYLDLHPQGFTQSYGSGISGNLKVG